MSQVQYTGEVTYKIQVVLNKVVLEQLVRQCTPGELLNEFMVRIALPGHAHVRPVQKIFEKASSLGH